MQSWYGDTGLIFYNLHDAINPFLTVGTSDSLAFFIDDQWNPTRRLTVNLGLRYDNMTAKYGEGIVYDRLLEAHRHRQSDRQVLPPGRGATTSSISRLGRPASA